MVGHEVGMQHHVAVYLDDIVAGSAFYGFVADGPNAETAVFMPHVDERHGAFDCHSAYQCGGFGTRAVVGYQHFVGHFGLRQYGEEHQFEAVRGIVSGDDERSLHVVLEEQGYVVNCESENPCQGGVIAQ